MGTMYHYRAYGLAIHSELAMPELLEGEGAPDLVVRYGSIPPPGAMPEHYRAHATPDEIMFYMEDVGGVVVRGGREMIVDPLPGAEERGFRFLASGIGLGLALHQRGLLSLHASAVALDGGVVAFMGWKGMGKSTTAAALHAQGYPVVTDDLLALVTDSDQVLIAPAFPHLKLMPESITASLGGDPESLPRVHPAGSKRTRDAREGFQNDPLPLRCIYVLGVTRDEDAPPHFEAIPQAQACIEVMRHSLVLRILDEDGASGPHLQQCAALVRRVPVRRLIRPHALHRLPDLVRSIEADVARLASGGETGTEIAR